MCLGKKSMFTPREEKLLKLAEASKDPKVQATAQSLRDGRRNTLKVHCDQLHAAGKF